MFRHKYLALAVATTCLSVPLLTSGSAIAATVSSGGNQATIAGVPLRDLVAHLSVADEVRDGYDRAKFKHWVDADHDGCDTRAEVLLAEASTPPTVGPQCSIDGGGWYSAYDDTYLTRARASDIDHMVPLAEAWDSGASAWTPKQREAYANDLNEPRALIAVTARTNRSKADQDPSEWLPPYEPARCGYITDWTVVKTRWHLTVDPAEKTALTDLATDCPNIPLTVIHAM